MQRGSADAINLALFFLVMTVLTVAGFAAEWRPPVVSDHGKNVDGIITYLLIATGAIFVLGHVVLAWFVVKYRGDGPSIHRPVSSRAEWLTALVPVLVMTLVAEAGVLVLALPVWGQLYGEAPKDALVVEVTGKQFEWIVRYPGGDGKFGRTDPKAVDDAENPLGLVEEDDAAADDVVKRGTLVIPVGRAVVLRLRSLDVLHSFTVPEFRVKQDVIPGFTARTQFTIQKTGTYEIACVELCGLGHYKMRGFVQVKTPDEFGRWLEDQDGMFE